MKLANIGKRARQIKKYCSLAYSYGDYVGLIALGIARGHSFDSDDLIGSLGKKFYPSLHARLKPFGGGASLH
jgi:hypothetical protein